MTMHPEHWDAVRAAVRPQAVDAATWVGRFLESVAPDVARDVATSVRAAATPVIEESMRLDGRAASLVEEGAAALRDRFAALERAGVAVDPQATAGWAPPALEASLRSLGERALNGATWQILRNGLGEYVHGERQPPPGEAEVGVVRDVAQRLMPQLAEQVAASVRGRSGIPADDVARVLTEAAQGAGDAAGGIAATHLGNAVEADAGRFAGSYALDQLVHDAATELAWSMGAAGHGAQLEPVLRDVTAGIVRSVAARAVDPVSTAAWEAASSRMRDVIVPQSLTQAVRHEAARQAQAAAAQPAAPAPARPAPRPQQLG